MQIPRCKRDRPDRLQSWLEQFAVMLCDFWVHELHTPGSRDLLRMVLAMPLDSGAELSDNVLDRVRRTFLGLGTNMGAFHVRVKYIRHACGRAFFREGAQGMNGWLRRLLAHAIVEDIPGTQLQELDGVAMHCYIIWNLLVLLDLPRESFSEAAKDTDSARVKVGAQLMPSSSDDDAAARKEAGKTAINAVVYGQSLNTYNDFGPPPLLFGLRSEREGLLQSLRNLGILEVWKAIATTARAKAKARRKGEPAGPYANEY